MSDAVALLTELAQKVADARDAERAAADKCAAGWDVVSDDQQCSLNDAYELACHATKRAERYLASMAIRHLLNQ